MIKAFVTNLGMYNEGCLCGEWVDFPVSKEELACVFRRIHIGDADAFGQPYEEWFITDYDCEVSGIIGCLGEYENLDELNFLAAKLDKMHACDREILEAVLEAGFEMVNSVEDLINLVDNVDCYAVYPEVNDEYDLGYCMIHEMGCYDLDAMGSLADYIDYKAYGRDCAIEMTGDFTKFGFIEKTDEPINDFCREDIPAEYVLM